MNTEADTGHVGERHAIVDIERSGPTDRSFLKSISMNSKRLLNGGGAGIVAVFMAIALIFPLTLSSNLSVQTAQAADTTYDYSGYTITDKVPDTRFAEPDAGYTTIMVVREKVGDTPTNWYFTFSMLRSDIMNSVTPTVLRVRVWYDDNGTARSQTRFNLTYGSADQTIQRTSNTAETDQSVPRQISIQSLL